MVNAILTDSVKELPQVNESQGKLLADAAADYSQSIDLFPDRVDVYRKRAFVRYRLSLFDLSEADYRRVLSLAPEDHRSMFELAHIRYVYKHDCSEALSLLNRAITLEPDNAAYQAERAAVIGREDKAAVLSILNNLIDKEPIYLALRHRGDLYQSLGMFEEAAADGRMAIKAGPHAQTGWTIQD